MVVRAKALMVDGEAAVAAPRVGPCSRPLVFPSASADSTEIVPRGGQAALAQTAKCLFPQEGLEDPEARAGRRLGEESP